MESSERALDKIFSNGDVYVGGFKGLFPHGKGLYTWSDGTVYDGHWEEGKMTGKGRITWPSGNAYEGDFSGNFLHGFGTFTGSDGTSYRGNWSMNSHHGIGRKKYHNADVYDGSWKEGIREGSGRYIWSSGNLYIGSWKNGKMSGRGIMKWTCGDLFDGRWLNGARHGTGCYQFLDGSYYFGIWTKGLKDGLGTFYPAKNKNVSAKGSASERKSDKKKKQLLSSENLEKPGVSRSFSEKLSRNSSQRSRRTASLGGDYVLDDISADATLQDPSSASFRSDEDLSELTSNGTIACEREYMQGVLIKERIRSVRGRSLKLKKKCKLHAEEVKMNSCVNVFERNKSYYLMLNLQLGIRYTVGKITPVPAREVRSSDFGERARIRMYFPSKGSQFTPPHHSVDFYWKDYCPMVFRNLREMFKLNAADYMMSICGDDGLREIVSAGKSGSIFYTSGDDRFVIKTLTISELKAFLRMLPRYYDHVKEHENTLVTKFFGLHRIVLRHGKKVRFVVMGNMFCTELHIHRRYDLKGSTHGRITRKDKVDEGTTLKDLDLKYEFHMDKLLREALFKQINLDCTFLESQHILDYSLLLGLHFRAPEHLTPLLEAPYSVRTPDRAQSAVDGSNLMGELSIPPSGLLLVTHEPSFVSTEPGPHIRGSTLRAMSVGDKEVDLLLPGTARLRVQLGVNMPAQARRRLKQNESDPAEVELFEVYDVVLYMGIIDILQEYNLRKKLEHSYKAMQFDPMTVSVIEPKLYSKRFVDFLEKVFPAPQ